MCSTWYSSWKLSKTAFQLQFSSTVWSATSVIRSSWKGATASKSGPRYSASGGADGLGQTNTRPHMVSTRTGFSECRARSTPPGKRWLSGTTTSRPSSRYDQPW